MNDKALTLKMLSGDLVSFVIRTSFVIWHSSFVISNSTKSMSDDLFPSGPWTGFYNYGPGDRHRMDLALAFANGSMSGDGADDIGAFAIRGRYDAANQECHWTKSYLGAHDVFYRGFREGKGIWGTWEIGIYGHGGFHIWPRCADEGTTKKESVEQTEPVDAIATSVN